MDPSKSEWPTLKHDLHTGERWSFDHGAGRTAGEPVFVARQGGTAEDDGWLMTFVHDPDGHPPSSSSSTPRTSTGATSPRCRCPQRIPYGFHGNWVSDRSVPESASWPDGRASPDLSGVPGGRVARCGRCVPRTDPSVGSRVERA